MQQDRSPPVALFASGAVAADPCSALTPKIAGGTLGMHASDRISGSRPARGRWRTRVGGTVNATRSGGAAAFRVGIAVRPALWRQLLARMLAEEPDLTVVGNADNEETLHALIAEASPDVVLFDNEALGPGSEGVISRMRWAHPDVRLLVLASRSGEETVVAVLRAGAAGLVDKQASLETLLSAIRAVCNGETWANRRATARALAQLARPGTGAEPDQPALTPRELDVVGAVGRGLRNREIAAALGISEKTVKTHLNSVFGKVGVRTRTALALWAMRQVQLKT